MRAVLDLALVMARNAVAKTDDAACNRGWDELEARFGWEIAAQAWRQACREMDEDA